MTPCFGIGDMDVHLNYKGLRLSRQKNMHGGWTSYNWTKRHNLWRMYIWKSAQINCHFQKLLGEQHLHLNQYMLTFLDQQGLNHLEAKDIFFCLLMILAGWCTWVYFLEQKLEAFSHFIQFKKMVGKTKWSSLESPQNRLRRRIHNHCNNEGIRRQLTIRYTAQQNGVAERKNRTIVEMAWSML